MLSKQQFMVIFSGSAAAFKLPDQFQQMNKNTEVLGCLEEDLSVLIINYLLYVRIILSFSDIIWSISLEENKCEKKIP